MSEETLVAPAFHGSSQSQDDGDATRLMLSDSDIGETLAACQYCSQCFAARDLEVHILNCPQKDFNNENYDTVIGSSEMLPENICALKTLPDVVPVQDALFHMESFPNNLPHSKSFMSSSENQQDNGEDVKNFEDIEAFSVCMDLINSDQDLKRIVQGIESLDQMENNYLTFMPSAGAPNLLNPNIDTEIQKPNEPAVPNQNLAVCDKDEFNNSAMQPPGDPEFESGRIHSVNSRGNVFEFTEKDYEASKPAQKLIHSKPQTSFTEKISPNSSKNTNEAVTFSTIAEMIKATISDDCNGELEAFETLPKVTFKEKSHEAVNPQKTELEFWICQYCSKKLRSASSLKRHILKLHPNENADSQADLPQKFDSVSPPADLPYSYPQSLNDLSVNSSHIESSNSVTPITSKNLKMTNTSEMGPLPKGRIKGFTKSPSTPCKICGKLLTAGYMKTHISKQHSGQQNEISIKTEISSSVPYDATVSLSSQVESSNFPTVSTVTEQDIDSSTCLSASDAVKRNGSYTIADASNLSNGSDKVSESTNVKFNFNDLEFSRDAHADGKASTFEVDQNLFPKLETSFSENVESVENDVKPNVVYTRGGFVFRNHFCTACPKAYSSSTTLRKHMKTIHNLDLPKAPRKSKKLTNPPRATCEVKPNIQPVNIPENHEKSPQFHKEGIPSTSKTATPVLQRCLLRKSGATFKKPLPNANNNLLKSVLVKSVPPNFKSKQLKNSKNCSEGRKGKDYFGCAVNANTVMQTPDNEQKICYERLSSNIISNLPLIAPENELNICNEQLKDNISSNLPLQILENEQNKCNEQLSGDFNSNLLIQTFENEQKMCNELLNNNLNCDHSLKISGNEQKVCNEQLSDNLILNHSIQISENEQKFCNEQLNSDFESGCNFSNSVPSENLQTGETESMQATSNFLVPETVVSNIPSEAEQFDYFQLNTILAGNNILQTRHFNPSNTECNADCENLSVQSNEISPVSEIISNVSKYQFGGTSNGEDQKELDDNSLKLSIPKNQKESVNSENQNFQVPTSLLQEFKSKQKESNDMSNNSDLPCNFLDDCLSDTNQNISEVETVESLTEDIVCEKHISPSSEIKCRLCHQNLSSMNSLTKHLKEVHDIPVLKKPISQPPVKLSSCVQESVKLSPPKLKLGPNESDSESVSNFYNPPTYLKSTSEQLEMTSSQKILDNSCVSHLLPSEQCVIKKKNIFNASGLFESLEQLKRTETEMQPKQPDPLDFLIPDSECQRKPVTVTSPCKYKFRRHSFCDNKSFFLQVKNNKSLSTAEINHLISNINFKNNCEIIKMKSVSLPNFQVTLKHVTTSHIEHEMKKSDTSLKSVDCVPDENSDHPVKYSEVAVEDSAGENKSLSSVDVPEVSKTSCDISSESYPIQLNAIAINSDFVLPNPLLNPPSQVPPAQPTKRKISHRKLLLKNIKSYKSNKIRRVKNKCFSCHKVFKPIILTLKETTEISDFLKTHKQPTVKLIRLKEDSDSRSKPLIKEVSPICDKYPLKEAVVKLERLKIPKDFGDLFLVKQKLVSSVLSQKTHFNSVTMQNAENQSINFPNGFYVRSSRVGVSRPHVGFACSRVDFARSRVGFTRPRVSSVHAIPPIEIDLTDSNSDIVSCDSHQNVEALAMEVKCPVQTEGCTVPLPKKCFVVLKRISV